jgi:hypothetical protein
MEPAAYIYRPVGAPHRTDSCAGYSGGSQVGLAARRGDHGEATRAHVGGDHAPGHRSAANRRVRLTRR